MKAYDNVRWDFLFDVLEAMCFSNIFVHWIESMCYKGYFMRKKGLRQDDPLSLYLFLLCVEGLTALIQKAQQQGAIHGVRAVTPRILNPKREGIRQANLD